MVDLFNSYSHPLYSLQIKIPAGLFVHRGLLLLQWKGDINEALKLLEKAIEVDDKCEFAYETLGTVEVQRGLFPVMMNVIN